MPYVEGQTVHDADSHVMELPGQINGYVDPKFRAAFVDRIGKKGVLTEWFANADKKHDDPEFRAGAEANILLRKNYEALGAFRASDRPATLDHLGFASQLVFTTACLSNFGLEQMGEVELALEGARAHNRMMTEFCSVDRRLLATGYVPLIDRARAPQIAREALALGAKALIIPSRHPPGFSPSHRELDPLWAVAQEAQVPILFHVGGEEKMHKDYLENGLPFVKDFHGGDENFTSLTFMAIPLSVWQTLSALVIDGVFDRFPNLKFGAIELGASWLPSLMKFLDFGCAAFGREERLQKLSGTPSEILRRQLRVTPYPHEDVAWIMANSGEEMVLFSSDFPHVEGGRNPLKRFNDSLAGVDEARKRRFYRDNFIDLMGAGLDRSLHDLPSLAAARVTRAEVTELHWRDPPLDPIALPGGKGEMRLTLSFGSGLGARPGDLPGRVWGLGDRGPNIKIKTAIRLYGLGRLKPLKDLEGAKVLPLPHFQPMLAELQVEGDRVNLVRTLPLRTMTTLLSGRPLPSAAGQEMEPAFDLDGHPLPDDPAGCDPEGVAVLADGGFFVSEEYGPSILKVGADGVVRARWTPPGVDVPGALPVLPAAAKRRRLNRGFEGVCLSGDERWLYAGFQSGFEGASSLATTIWKLDAATGALAAEYSYPFDPPASFRRDVADGCDASDLKVCELVWLGPDRLLVLERITRDARLDRVDVTAPGRLAKTLLFTTDDHPAIAPDLEGVTLLDEATLLLATDNDFGTEGAETRFYRVSFDEAL